MIVVGGPHRLSFSKGAKPTPLGSFGSTRYAVDAPPHQ